MRAITSRPNICGTNAYHTFGGVLLRPSSTKADAVLPPDDVWTWKQLGCAVHRADDVPGPLGLRGLHVGRAETMSGAADDWSYEHLGVFSWTTEFWDVIHAATGERAPTSIWYVARRSRGRTPGAALVRRSTIPAATSTGTRSTTRSSDRSSSAAGSRCARGTTLRRRRLDAEVAGHADFAVFQALASPRLAIEQSGVGARSATALADRRSGIANTGWLPDHRHRAGGREASLVLPLAAELVLARRGRRSRSWAAGTVCCSASWRGAIAGPGSPTATTAHRIGCSTSWVVQAPGGSDAGDRRPPSPCAAAARSVDRARLSAARPQS